MVTTLEMLRSTPTPPKAERIKAQAALVDAALACAQACTTCASSCVSEPDPKPLADCILACLDCADVCTAIAGTMSRPQAAGRRAALVALLEACSGLCELAIIECHKHEEHHYHCKLCKLVCRAYLEASEKLLESI